MLLAVFLCQTAIKYISRASVGRVPVDIVSQLIAMSVPSVLFVMLPLSLFIAIMTTLGRISSDSELVVLHSAGVSHYEISKIALIIAFLTAGVTAVNNLWLMPKSVHDANDLKNNAENDPSYMPIESGRFVNFGAYNVYIEKVDEGRDTAKHMGNVYVFQNPYSDRDSAVVLSDSGRIVTDKDGVQWLRLINANRYEGPLADGTFRAMSFKEVSVPTSNTDVEESEDDDLSAVPTLQLLGSQDPREVMELQWRLSSVISVLVLTLIAVPLSSVNPRQGKFTRIMPAIGLYAAYFLFTLSMRNLVNVGYIGPWPGVYVVPVLFLICGAVPLNLNSYYKKRLWGLIFRKKQG